MLVNKYTSKPGHKYKITQVHRFTRIQVFKYTSTQLRQYTFSQVFKVYKYTEVIIYTMTKVLSGWENTKTHKIIAVGAIAVGVTWSNSN